jgi:putative membrane protein
LISISGSLKGRLMMKRSLCQAFGCALLLSLSGLGSAQADSTGDTKGVVSAGDTTFIQSAATDGLAEISMGQLAVNKSSNAQVKALAQHIVDDHTKSNEALKSLADSKKVSFPSETSKDAQKESDKLGAMKGEAFDEAWLKAMVKDHQDAIKLFAQEAKQTKDTDIQQYVKTTTPTLKSHLAAAQQLVAVRDARDQAMDSATKAMSSDMDSTPAAASTVTAAAVKSPAPATTPAAPATPTAPAAASGAKH